MKDNILDPNQIQDIEEVILKIDELEKKIEQANELVISIHAELKGADSIVSFTAAIQKQQDAISDSSDMLEKQTSLIQQYGQRQIEAANNIANTAKQLNDLETTLAEVTEQWETASKRGVTSSAEYAQRANILTQQISQLSDEMAQMKDAVNNTERALDKMNTTGQNSSQVFDKFTGLISALGNLTGYGKAISAVVAGLSLLDKAFFHLEDKLSQVSDEEEYAKRRLDEYTESLKHYKEVAGDMDVNKDIKIAISKEDVTQTIAIMQDETQSIEARTEAYNQLLSIMPGVFNGMTQEEAMNQKNSEAVYKNAKAIIVLTKNIEELKKARDASQAALTQALASQTDQERNYSGTINDRNPEKTREIKGLQKAVNDDNRALGDARAQLARINTSENKPALTEPKIATLHRQEESPASKNKKQMEAELRTAEENRKKMQDIALKEYAESKQTEQDKIDLLNRTVAAEDEAKAKEFATLDKWAGKIGETKEQEGARRAAYEEKYAGLDAKAAETRSRINKEIADEYAKADEMNKEYVAGLEAHAQKIDELTAKRNDAKLRYAELHATSAGPRREEKRKEFEENLAIGQGEQQVREDNQEAGKAQTRVNKANEQVQNDEVNPDGTEIPMESRNKEKYDADLKERNEAQKQLSAIQEKTDADADNVTDLRKQAEQRKEDEQNAQKRAAMKEMSGYTIQLAQATFDAVKQIRDNQFAAEQQQLQIKMQRLQLSTQQQLQAIDATAGYAVTKDNEKAKVAAQAAAQENAIQQQQNNLALKKAKADKQAAESGVLMNTALAIAKTLPMLSNPITAAIGVAEIAVIAAIGAAQYAAAASTPLPQFAEGGTTTTPYFIAGEAGAEIIAPPGKKPYWSMQAAVHHEPIGTEVIPVQKMLEHARQNVAGGSYGQLSEMQAIYNNHVIAGELAKLYKGNKENTEDMVMAIYRASGRPVKNTVVVDMKNALQRPRS